MLTKVIAFVLIFCLGFEQSGFCQVAHTFDLSSAFSGMSSVEQFRPVQLRSLSFDKSSSDYKLFLDKGDAGAQVMESSAQKLLEYFRVGVNLPDSAFWVNLRPDGEHNVIDPLLEQTDLGKVLLEADLALKKDMARLTSPATAKGRAYWKKLYARAELLYGTKDVNIPTMTRPWIVPGEIIVRLSGESAYVYKGTLKVQLEHDRLKNSQTYDFSDARMKELNEYSTQLIRELILPQLTRKVNSAKTYAQLRQVYYSLILAQWFKRSFTGTTTHYADRINSGNLEGLTSRDSWSKKSYFEAYRDSFKKGEYNSSETVTGANGTRVRTYTSGGISIMPKFSNPGVVTLDGGRGVMPSGIMAVNGTGDGKIAGNFKAINTKETGTAAMVEAVKDGGRGRYDLTFLLYAGGLSVVGIAIMIHVPWLAMVGLVMIPLGFIIERMIEDYNWMKFKQEQRAQYGSREKRWNLEDHLISTPKKPAWPGDFGIPYNSDKKDGGRGQVTEEERINNSVTRLAALGTLGIGVSILGGVMHIPLILFPAAVFTFAAFIGTIVMTAISPYTDYSSKVFLPYGLGFACFATGLVAYNLPLIVTGVAVMVCCKLIVDTILKARARFAKGTAVSGDTLSRDGGSIGDGITYSRKTGAIYGAGFIFAAVAFLTQNWLLALTGLGIIGGIKAYEDAVIAPKFNNKDGGSVREAVTYSRATGVLYAGGLIFSALAFLVQNVPLALAGLAVVGGMRIFEDAMAPRMINSNDGGQVKGITHKSYIQVREKMSSTAFYSGVAATLAGLGICFLSPVSLAFFWAGIGLAIVGTILAAFGFALVASPVILFYFESRPGSGNSPRALGGFYNIINGQAQYAETASDLTLDERAQLHRLLQRPETLRTGLAWSLRILGAAGIVVGLAQLAFPAAAIGLTLASALTAFVLSFVPLTMSGWMFRDLKMMAQNKEKALKESARENPSGQKDGGIADEKNWTPEKVFQAIKNGVHPSDLGFVVWRMNAGDRQRLRELLTEPTKGLYAWFAKTRGEAWQTDYRKYMANAYFEKQLAEDMAEEMAVSGKDGGSQPGKTMSSTRWQTGTNYEQYQRLGWITFTVGFAGFIASIVLMSPWLLFASLPVAIVGVALVSIPMWWSIKTQTVNSGSKNRKDGGKRVQGARVFGESEKSESGEREAAKKDDLGGIDMNLHSTQIKVRQTPDAAVPAGVVTVSLSELKQQWLEIRQTMAKDGGKLPCAKIANYITNCNSRQDTEKQLAEVAECISRELEREEALVIPTRPEVVALLNQLG